MDKNAIKKYAVWARRELISRVSQRALIYGISSGEIQENADSINGKLLTRREKSQRAALISRVKQIGYEQVIEEVAYTWFNRFCALRFMEVNGYLPSHVRVFTDENNAFNPQILTETLHIELEGLNKEIVFNLKEKNQTEELYKYLLIVQCNALNSVLPVMFQKIEDYTELLFPDNILRQGSVVEQLVSQIPEEDFNIRSGNGQVEIIGWLYQYYISEKHEQVVDPLHGKVVKKEEVAAATQLFTTDWVVRYIVYNSVGRYWIERHPESKLKERLKYFVSPKTQPLQAVNEDVSPQDLTVFDPCLGSGHFLVYAFEVLMKIYSECGYTDRDAARLIVENNLYGVDIDDRATQLAYFAVMMKARSYDRRFFERGVQPKVYSIPESNFLEKNTIEYIAGGNSNLYSDIQKLYEAFYDGKEYGSIIKVPQVDFAAIYARFNEIENDVALLKDDAINNYLPLINVAHILSQKYAVVATNPPYLNKYDAKLKSYVQNHYKDYCGDLFSVFIYRNFDFCKPNGYSGFMTPNVWMFIKTYEKLRHYILDTKTIVTLVQMAKGAFFKEATVDICCFVLKNAKVDIKGLYFRLEDFKGDMEVQRQKIEQAIANHDCGYFYEATASNFSKIPGSPIAYWISLKIFNLLTYKSIKEICTPCLGMRTGDNDRFLRLWHEVSVEKASYQDLELYNVKKWIPFNKGGGFRRWYGMNEYLVNWENNGEEIKENTKIKYGENISWKISNEKFYFIEGITWGSVTSGVTTFRYYPKGFIFSNCGQAVIMDNLFSDKIYRMCAYLNSKLVIDLLAVLSPTIGCESGYVAKLPFVDNLLNNSIIDKTCQDNIKLSKSDWDSYETSWDFKKHPLI